MTVPFAHLPTPPIAFGEGRLDELPAFAASVVGAEGVVLLVTDAACEATGIADRVRQVLALAACPVRTFAEAGDFAQTATVDRVADTIRVMGTPCVVGLGGGGALDTAKLAAVLAAAEEASADDHLLAARALPRREPPLILLPTAADGGTEGTRTALVADRDGRRLWAWGDGLIADLVLLDPRLAMAADTETTVASGLGAVVNAAEAVTARRRNPLAEAFALHALREIRVWLPRAATAGAEAKVRGHMQLAAMIAGMAAEAAGTGLAHAIGLALGGVAGLDHGHAVALAFGAVLPWVAETAQDEHGRLAEALGGAPEAIGAAPAFAALVERCGGIAGIAEPPPPEALAKAIMDAAYEPMRDNTPRPVDAAAARHLAERILTH